MRDRKDCLLKLRISKDTSHVQQASVRHRGIRLSQPHVKKFLTEHL
jgi:hypothetical protein